MSAWRFENMMLMMVNSRGSDALFEEVALNGLDFNGGWATGPIPYSRQACSGTMPIRSLQLTPRSFSRQ